LARDLFVVGLMPTRDRHTFVDRSIRMWGRQTYARRQLLIVTDGAVDPAWTNDPFSISILERPAGPSGVSSMAANIRAGIEYLLACPNPPDLIAIWEDDDFYLDDRVERQVSALKNLTAHGQAFTHYYDVQRRAWHLTRHVGRSSNFLTMIRTDWFRKHRYPDGRYPDVSLWQSLHKDEVALETDESRPLGIGIKHGRGPVAGRGHAGMCRTPDPEGYWLSEQVEDQPLLRFYLEARCASRS
jgi:hypothetical protein